MQTVSRVLSHGRTELAKIIVGDSARSDEPNEYQRLTIRLRIAGLAGVLSTRVLILRVLGWR